MRGNIVSYLDPKAPISEMFRALRTNIQFMATGKKVKTILMTSTLPNEGKSWVSSNTAVTFAQSGKKVLILDADMRKSVLNRIFDIKIKPGLSNYLCGVDEEGKNEFDDNLELYIQKTEIDNLYILPAGSVPPNPAELLMSENMQQLLAKLKKMFDVIIIDGTPCELVTDSVILSRLVDITILVTSYKNTKKEAVKKIAKNIESVGGHINGVVLNKYPINASKYEKLYYYGKEEERFLDTKIKELNYLTKKVTKKIKEENRIKKDKDTKVLKKSTFSLRVIFFRSKQKLKEKKEKMQKIIKYIKQEF